MTRKVKHAAAMDDAIHEQVAAHNAQVAFAALRPRDHLLDELAAAFEILDVAVTCGSEHTIHASERAPVLLAALRAQ